MGPPLFWGWTGITGLGRIWPSFLSCSRLFLSLKEKADLSGQQGGQTLPPAGGANAAARQNPHLSSSRRAFSFSYHLCCSSLFLRSAACWAVTGAVAGGGGSGSSA